MHEGEAPVRITNAAIKGMAKRLRQRFLFENLPIKSMKSKETKLTWVPDTAIMWEMLPEESFSLNSPDDSDESPKSMARENIKDSPDHRVVVFSSNVALKRVTASTGLNSEAEFPFTESSSAKDNKYIPSLFK